MSGGAGVHVEYLAAELAKLMEVEVRSFGDQNKAATTVKGFPLTIRFLTRLMTN